MPPLSQPPVVPRPLHNERGTVLSLARQTLHDLDPDSLNTTLPTAVVGRLLSYLCDTLTAVPRAAVDQAAVGLMTDPTSNPTLAYWQRAAEKDEERADADE